MSTVRVAPAKLAEAAITSNTTCVYIFGSDAWMFSGVIRNYLSILHFLDEMSMSAAGGYDAIGSDGGSPPYEDDYGEVGAAGDVRNLTFGCTCLRVVSRCSALRTYFHIAELPFL